MTQKEIKNRNLLGLKNNDEEGKINYSVKAGAGGGKTTMFSYRICEQILSGIPIDAFVIITYTNAAAAELREKITSRLYEVIADPNETPERKQTATEVLGRLELMQISTIHSFLLKILKENAFESGIAVDAVMIEGEKELKRKEDFFNEWYREHYEEIVAFRDDWMIPVRNGRPYDKNREVFLNMFLSLADVREEVQCTDSSLIDFDSLFDAYLTDYLAKWLPKFSGLKQAIIDNQPIDDKNKRIKVNPKIEDSIINLDNKVGDTSKSLEERAAYIFSAFEKVGEIVKDHKIYRGVGETREVAIDRQLEYILGEMASCEEREWNYLKYKDVLLGSIKASKVAKYVCAMKDEYQKVIDANTKEISNNDILYRAEKLLLEHSEIVKKLRKQYSKIYVDEFQDTTALQTRIIKMISEDSATGSLANYKLMVVGDPKQSIYRFTGAEKEIYDQFDAYIAGMGEGAKSVTLDANFRSNKDIVDWVNGCYASLMPGYTDMETDWGVNNDQALHGVYGYGSPADYDIDSDVEAVTSLIKTLVNDEKYFIEKCHRNKNNGYDQPTLHKIKYSDIMVIFADTFDMDRYVNRLALEGIPVNVQGKFKITEDLVLRNYVKLITYLANYKNKKNRISAQQVLCGGDATNITKESLEFGQKKLSEIRFTIENNHMNVPAVLEYIYSNEEFYIPKDFEISVEERRSYKIRLNQMIEACLSKNDGDLSKVAMLLDNYMQNDVKREIPLESNENSIRLMNVHQSKGLTAEIVIIAKRNSEDKCKYSGFKKDGKYFPTATYVNTNGFGNANYPAYAYDSDLMKEVCKAEMDEKIRLQYVAATRAAHALIIMPAIKNKKAWFSQAEYGYQNLPDINEWIEKRAEDTNEYAIQSEGVLSAGKVITLSDLQANLSNKSSLDKKQLISITPSGLEPDFLTGFDSKDTGFVKEDRPGQNIFGNVMHRVYEIIFMRRKKLSNMSDTDRKQAIDRIINQSIIESIDDLHDTDDPAQFRSYLNEVMDNYYDNVIVPIIDSAEEIYPEYAFSFYVPEEERDAFKDKFKGYLAEAKESVEIKDETLWVNGKADLVVVQKDGKVKIYDYKSDAMNGKLLEDFEKALAKKYEGQLALYKYAIAKSFGVSEVDTEIIHLYRQK